MSELEPLDPAPVSSAQQRRPRRRLWLPAAAVAAVLSVTGASLAVTRTTHAAPGASASPGWRFNGSASNGSGGGAQWTPRTPYGQGNLASAAPDTREPVSGEETGMVLVRTNVGYGSAAAAGTGMVVDSDGLVVTNHHVVEGATGIRVEVAATGRTYRATVLGTDATHDVALLRLDGAHGLATVATDSSASVGEKVTAIGDADGADSLTAADGRLTALRSSITVQDDQGGDHRLTRLIQVDADVVPGDSGGAVLDGDGKVIAMTTAATSGSPQVSGYAIPIGRVLSIAGAIETGRESGTVTIGYDGFLGVELADDTGTAAPNPVVAGVVDGTAAASLGMAPGDTIVAVDGTSVSTAAQLHNAIASHRPGQRVSVTWTDADGVMHEGAATLTRGPVA